MDIKQILQKEAPEIPIELIVTFHWSKQKVNLKEVSVNKEMWEKHIRSKLHKERLQSIL